MAQARTILITGTDTSVGKTAVTALLLAAAQSQGAAVRALKPFSTGGGGDEALLASMQDDSLQINFFHYPEPIAPWSAARLHRAPVSLQQALDPIRRHAALCDLLLIEGAGGLLTPLGKDFTAADLAMELQAEVIIVAANRLGVLNHTLLTAVALRTRKVQRMKIALVENAGADFSRKTNGKDLSDLLPEIPVIEIPFLPNYISDASFIRSALRNVQYEINSLLAC
jgi:dethiobiotin synthetase